MWVRMIEKAFAFVRTRLEGDTDGRLSKLESQAKKGYRYKVLEWGNTKKCMKYFLGLEYVSKANRSRIESYTPPKAKSGKGVKKDAKGKGSKA